jgi:hypothetical protein
MAASGQEATQTAAKYTDGLITTAKPDKSKNIFDILTRPRFKMERIQTTYKK